MGSNKSISVVIPNFNGEGLLKRNLPFLYEALKIADAEYEIIIPDDASSDNSVAFLKTHYPDIIVIANPRNQGFGTNINSGIRVATKNLVFILNSDIELTPYYFAPVLRHFSDEKVFGVMGRIIGLDSDVIQDAAKYPAYQFTNINATINYRLASDQNNNAALPSFFLSGANALVDRVKLAELGGFSELYSPFYFEDVDLGLRAWRLGYTCLYEHEAVCRHPNSVTIKKYNSNDRVKIVAKRNKMFLHFMHLNGLELYSWFALLLIKVLGRALMLDKKFIKSFRAFYQNLPAARNAKQEFKDLQNRKGVPISVAQVRENILASIKDYPIIKF